jgi:RHS repeat-associated protein
LNRHNSAGDIYFVAREAIDSVTINCVYSCVWVVSTNMARDARYYDANGRLRAADNRGGGSKLYEDPPGFEEYRYDALGRRVLKRLRNSPGNAIEANLDVIQRFIWDGDHLLSEIQYPGDNSLSAAQLERDTVTLSGSSRYYGRVLYLTGTAIDQPLSIIRIGFAQSIGGTMKKWDPTGLVPHFDLQGRGFSQAIYGPEANCKSVGSSTGCIEPNWPARSAYGIGMRSETYPHLAYGGWYGSLAQDQIDGSGQQYRRNRYYDPVSGRFTQEDPIGLAGGLNLYGYTGGDPINYGDPFGLDPCLRLGNCTQQQESYYTTAVRQQEMHGNIESTALDPTMFIGGFGKLGGSLLSRAFAREAVVAAERSVVREAQIVINKRMGDAFRDEIADLFRKNGYDVATEVGKRTPFGRRVIDIEVSRGGRLLGGIETKTGNSPHTVWQQAKDAWLRLTGYFVDVVRK